MGKNRCADESSRQGCLQTFTVWFLARDHKFCAEQKPTQSVFLWPHVGFGERNVVG